MVSIWRLMDPSGFSERIVKTTKKATMAVAKIMIAKVVILGMDIFAMTLSYHRRFNMIIYIIYE